MLQFSKKNHNLIMVQSSADTYTHIDPTNDYAGENPSY